MTITVQQFLISSAAVPVLKGLQGKGTLWNIQKRLSKIIFDFSSDSGSSNGCVVLKAPNFEWDADDCVSIKDFICEQTRCYYYNYGSIPVSTAQG